MTNKTIARAACVTVLLCGASTEASAQSDPAARIVALEQQIAALAAEVAEMKKVVAAAPQDPPKVAAPAVAPAPAPAPATVTIASGKPVIASADGAFSINFHAVAQLDTAHYFQDATPANGAVVGPDLNSGTYFRRARISVEGKLYRDFDYGFMIETGGAGANNDGVGLLHEAYLQYNGIKIGDQTLRIRGGAFPPNVGLQDATSQSTGLLLERSAAADIARGLAASDKRIGLQVATNADHWLAAVAVTGAKIGDPATFDEPLAYTARVAATPFHGQDWRVHLGANASYIARPPQTAPLSNAGVITLAERAELRNDLTSLVTTGAIAADTVRHVGVEFAFQKQQFLIQSEYIRFGIDRPAALGSAGNPEFDGFYVEGGWVLTGEARRYNPVAGSFDGPTIRSPFNAADGRWGAFELAARYSVLDLDFNAGVEGAVLPAGGVRGGKQQIIGAGLNWYLNSAIRFALQYQDVSVDRLNAAGTLQIGQDFQTVALRSQFGF